MERTFRWGIVGLGVIAHSFAKGLAACKHAKLYAVASHSHERTKAFAEEHSVPHQFSSYEQLFAMQEVDIVYIANINPLHNETIQLALEHGKHVLCEKPMTMDPEHSKKLFALAKAKGLFLMEAYWTACLPTYRTAKAWIEQGKIGKLQQVVVSFCFQAEKNPNSRLYNKELGGGALYDLGIYGIALALDFFSDYPQECKAEITYTPTGVDEYARLALSYPGNRSANLEFGFTHTSPNDAKLIGTEGIIELPNFWNGTDVICKKGTKTLISEHYPHKANGYEYEAEEVQMCLSNGRTTSILMPPDLTISTAKLISQCLSQS